LYPNKYDTIFKMDNELDAHDEKFDLMLEQIKELFFEFGIKNLNMDDISHKLGISKKTLYRYVKSKEDLIARLFDYEQLKWVNDSDGIGIQDFNAIEKLFKVSRLVYDEMKRFNPMLMFELRKYYESLFNEYHAKKLTHVSRSMRLNLAQGIKEGLYRRDINSEAVVAIYMNYLIEIHNSELCKMADVTFDELFSIMFENHIRAISTPEGVAYFELRKNEISGNLNKNIN
jgi:TetR/AcrR family transcriptional regulator, cholesterol catabolism regulator